MRIIAILNHEPTDEEKQELFQLGYNEVISIRHPQIPPQWDMQQVTKFVKTFEEKIIDKHGDYDALWVQGDFRFFYAFCQWANGHLPLYVATTFREAKEQKMPDGSIQKISIVRHIKFVRIV